MIERAFLYGDLLLESISVKQGEIRYAPMHYRRLKESAALLKYDLPDSFTESFFTNEIYTVLKKEELQDARVRFVLYRDSPGFYAPQQNEVKWSVDVAVPMPPRVPISRLGIFETYRKPCNGLSNLKSGNALIYVMAALFCRENNLEDCLLLNERGNIAEGNSTNVFMLKDGTMMTPALDEGCIRGVMRDVLIGQASKLGYTVMETAISPELIRSADEIFLSNASAGITSVVSFNGRELQTEAAAALRERL